MWKKILEFIFGVEEPAVVYVREAPKQEPEFKKGLFKLVN